MNLIYDKYTLTRICLRPERKMTLQMHVSLHGRSQIYIRLAHLKNIDEFDY